MNLTSSPKRPLVSVILAVYNEAHGIEACLSSLLAQEAADFDLEILAMDGNSTDGTRAILDRLAAFDARVRVVTNAKRKAPFAFNLGLREARGQYVCIFGSHTVYPRNYISVCLKELAAHGAIACGGRVITQPSDPSLESKLVAWVLSHPFGTSRKSFRTQAEGAVDTVNYPVMLKSALLEVGGYDEELIRNQDNDMNQKLRARGHKLVCTWKTSCLYHPSRSIKELLGYARRNGFWNAISLKKNRASMALRHFFPFFFVMSLLLSLLLATTSVFLPPLYRFAAILPLGLLLAAHLGTGFVASSQVAWRQKSFAALGLVPVFFLFHCAYGFGTLAGILSGVSWLRFSPQRAITPRVRLESLNQTK